MSAWRQAWTHRKTVALCLLVLLLSLIAWQLPRLPQPQSYHQFADPWVCLGTAYCLDISSNLLILLAGVHGLIALFRFRSHLAFCSTIELGLYRFFFAATVLVGLASAYYHFAPDDEHLAWDRAALALALMIWLATMLAERLSPLIGLRLLPLLLVAGLASVLYWHQSEVNGLGDLRFYLLTQAVPMLLVPLLLWLYPPRYSADKHVLFIIGIYAAALLCDLLDRQIAALLQLVSGHTLKHALVVLAIHAVWWRLQQRTILKPPTP